MTGSIRIRKYRVEIGMAGSNLGAANIRFNTLGAGYIYYVNENVKLVLYYARVMNEKNPTGRL